MSKTYNKIISKLSTWRLMPYRAKDIESYEEILVSYRQPFSNKKIAEVIGLINDFSKLEGFGEFSGFKFLNYALSSTSPELLDCLSEQEVFLIWDALGCDDKKKREIDPDIDALYLMIGKAWLKKKGWRVSLSNLVHEHERKAILHLLDIAKTLGHRPSVVF